MSRPVVVRPEAEQDLLSARDWYDRQRAGFGEAFVKQAIAIFDQLAEQPEMFATVWEDVRKCRLRRFPYLVYYRAFTDRVEVLAVLHGSRDPSVWQSRAEPR